MQILIAPAVIASLGELGKLDSGSDVVDMLADMRRQVILLTAYAQFASSIVLVLVKFSVQQAFNLGRGCIESEPTFVLRMNDSVCRYAGSNDPITNGIDCFLQGGKCVVNLFGGPMFSIVLGLGIGSGISS